MERDGEQCVLGDARSHDAARIQSRVRASALTDETVVGSASDFRRGIREDFHELYVSPATLPMYGLPWGASRSFSALVHVIAQI